MEHYQVKRAVGACDVDLGLLQKLEQCLTDEIEGSTTLTLSGRRNKPAKLWAQGRLNRKRKPEKQIFSSVTEYKHSEIEDGISSIVLERNEEGSENRVRLSLNSRGAEGCNQLLISMKGTNVNSRGPQIVGQIIALLNDQKAVTRFVHAAIFYPLFILFAVLPVAYLARDIIRAFSILETSYSMVATTLYTFLLVFVIRQFTPFCIFDSPANRKAKRIAGYAAVGAATIFILLIFAGA